MLLVAPAPFDLNIFGYYSFVLPLSMDLLRDSSRDTDDGLDYGTDYGTIQYNSFSILIGLMLPYCLLPFLYQCIIWKNTMHYSTY